MGFIPWTLLAIQVGIVVGIIGLYAVIHCIDTTRRKLKAKSRAKAAKAQARAEARARTALGARGRHSTVVGEAAPLLQQRRAFSARGEDYNQL